MKYAHHTPEPSQTPGSSTGTRLFVPHPLGLLSITGSQRQEGDFQPSLVPLSVANFLVADDTPGVTSRHIGGMGVQGQVDCLAPGYDGFRAAFQ
jgi:hypothetical protein